MSGSKLSKDVTTELNLATDPARPPVKRPLLPHVIAISSGKGGVGKSSLTVNLGISLAKTGAKVCIFDADTGLANINILLGLAPHARLEHVLSGDMPIEDIMLDGPFGLKVIPGANGISSCVDLHPRQRLRLTRELARIENQFDYLLLDTAAGIANTTLDFVCAATHALIVITPEPTSLTDAFSLIKLLKRRKSGNDFHIVVNMSANAAQAREIFHRFSAAVKKYIDVPLNYLGFIPRDESIRSAVTLQRPVSLFAETDPSCRNFARLSDSLAGAIEQSSVVTSSFSAYWHRLSRESEASAGDKTASTGANKTVNATGQLQVLQRQWLELVANEQLNEEQLRASLTELSSAFISHFNALPLDLLPLLDIAMTDAHKAADVAQQVFERIKEHVHYPSPAASESQDVDKGDVLVTGGNEYAEGSSHKTPGQDLATAARDLYTPLESVPAADEAQSAWPLNCGINGVEERYDSRKFGSQDHLVSLLQSETNNNKSLVDIIGALV